MNTFHNNYDTLEQLILEEDVSIQNVAFDKSRDLMLIILNTKTILKQKISSYKRLSNAREEELKDFEVVAKGKGIHWLKLDEDLSLKGFLKDELRNLLKSNGRLTKSDSTEKIIVERTAIDRPAREADFADFGESEIMNLLNKPEEEKEISKKKVR